MFGTFLSGTFFERRLKFDHDATRRLPMCYIEWCLTVTFRPD